MNPIIAVIGTQQSFYNFQNLFKYAKITNRRIYLDGNGTELYLVDTIDKLQGMEILDIIILYGADPDIVDFAKTRIRQRIMR